MNRAAKQRGFTLIELMLAMAFISVLLLAIAMTIIQIGTIYNRGMTLKEVNQTARSISDELTRSMSSTEAFTLTSKYITNSGGGRLCLGQYSYIWNTGLAIQNSDQNLTMIAAPSSNPPEKPIRFVKIPDASGIYCASDGTGLLARDVRPEDIDETVELLNAGDRTLTLHQFTVTSGTNAYDSATGQQLYNITFTIGTGNVSALNSNQTACLPPGALNSDFAYCTVQQFSLVTRAGNRVN